MLKNSITNTKHTSGMKSNTQLRWKINTNIRNLNRSVYHAYISRIYLFSHLNKWYKSVKGSDYCAKFYISSKKKRRSTHQRQQLFKLTAKIHQKVVSLSALHLLERRKVIQKEENNLKRIKKQPRGRNDFLEFSWEVTPAPCCSDIKTVLNCMLCVRLDSRELLIRGPVWLRRYF